MFQNARRSGGAGTALPGPKEGLPVNRATLVKDSAVPQTQKHDVPHQQKLVMDCTMTSANTAMKNMMRVVTVNHGQQTQSQQPAFQTQSALLQRQLQQVL